MRDECLRVAASLQPAAPSIVPGVQTSSGAGVSSAVFPPIDHTGAPQSGSVQTPYQPQATGGYGPPTPAPAPSYGYPQQGGYQTPPQTAAYAPQQGSATPPPYNIAPHQSSAPAGRPGGGKSNKGVIVGAIVVSVLAVGGLITAISLNSGSEAEGGDSGTDVSASPTVVEGHKGPDTSKVIESTACTEPTESYNDPDKIELPGFTFKNIDSVKKCLQAAGWEYDVQKVDENTYGEGTVMEQYPSADEDVDPKDMPSIILKVSTGNPA